MPNTSPVEALDWYPSLRRLRTPEQLAALQAAAASDNHAVVHPTHVITRNGEVVGYASILAPVALVNVWLHSQKVHARDSLHLLKVGETLAAETGASAVLFPCSVDSPFIGHMERLGFERLGASTLNLKLL